MSGGRRLRSSIVLFRASLCRESRGGGGRRKERDAAAAFCWLGGGRAGAGLLGRPPSPRQGGLAVSNPETESSVEQMAEICWSCGSLGSAEHRQLLLETRPARLFFLTCRRLRMSCRTMLEERGMSQAWGGRPGLGCRARGSLVSRLSPLCPSAASSLPAVHPFAAFSLTSLCPFPSMEILPGQGVQGHRALVVQISLEISDGDGKGMALTSPPALFVCVCSAFHSWQASLSIAPLQTWAFLALSLSPCPRST